MYKDIKKENTAVAAKEELWQEVMRFKSDGDPLLAIDLLSHFISEQNKHDGGLQTEEWNNIYQVFRLLIAIQRVPDCVIKYS